MFSSYHDYLSENMLLYFRGQSGPNEETESSHIVVNLYLQS